MRSPNKYHLLLVPALAFLVASGCGNGDDNGSASAAANPQLREQAGARAKRAASAVVEKTNDKYLPGPKFYKAVCLEPGDPAADDVPANQIKCHIEAFYKTYRGKRGGYLWSEDWLVPVLSGEKLGSPVISGEYRIRNFLIQDNKRNCTGRHQPHECLPPDTYAAPPDQPVP
jgi:hypothetical protein